MSRFAALGISVRSGSITRLTPVEPTTELRWPCARSGGEIEWTAAALSSVCQEAALGLRKLAKGGLEVGGLLFGERAEGLVRVLAIRPIQCEHRFGPSFVLSDTDEALLEETLAGFRSDSKLASLEILGCYFSHSRHGAALTDRDTDLCNRYFAHDGQLALVLIPSLSGTIQGTLFTRDSQGSYVSTYQFEHSVVIHPQRETVKRETPPPTGNGINRLRTAARLNSGFAHTPAQTPLEAAVHPIDVPVFVERVRPVQPAPMPPRREARLRPRVSRTSLLLAALILLICWPNRANPTSQIPLSFADRDGNLIIQWGSAPATIRGAVLGIVDIRDGEQEPVRISIGQDLLRRGWIPFERKSDIVRISFTVVGRGITISDNAIYFAPGRKTTAPPALVAKIPTINTIDTPSTIDTPPDIDARTVKSPEPTVLPKRETVVLYKPDSRVPRRSFRAPVSTVAKSASSTNIRPTLLPDAPALRLEGGTAAPLLQPALNLSFAAPRPPAVSPASGWLIWTGQLPKRSMLSLSAQGASLGYLSGWIPQTPVHVEVHSGELIEGGIVVFTKDQSLRSEAPSARNGWNTVVYKKDDARASELEILDTPGPANNWSHLTLRNGSRPLSLIVLDWRAQ